ncbi:hypothetical protein C8F01DRAFT_1063099 [Mycena amicta]|nr:hypothetical protein C8F01DRAFT_1063099 [Mycena amicta]
MRVLQDRVVGLTEQKKGYQQRVHALNARVKRFPARLQKAIQRVLGAFTPSTPTGISSTYSHKAHGIINDDSRDCMADLMALDKIPASRVASAFKRVAACLGVNVTDSVDRHSLRRITKEKGVAAQMQFVKTVHENASGVTLSGDGTSHKNEQYEVTNANVILKDGSRLHFFLGVHMAACHTSEAQLDGLVEIIEHLYGLLQESPELVGEVNAREFWNLVTGFHSDHAEDQKKLFRLLRELKQRIEREIRGERVLKSTGKTDVCSLAFQCGQNAIERAGGAVKWDALSAVEQGRIYNEARLQFIRDLGQADFDALSPEAQADVDLFLWAGCAMHKDLNAFKGAAAAMDVFWMGLDVAPVQQPNRDNDATIQLDPESAAAKRAREKTRGGAIKLASNCGLIFRHKDRKRGQQDTLRFYFDHEYGFNLAFPDTSNTRFQSHMEACAVLIQYRDWFIQFMEYIRDNKHSRQLNHLEANVYRALKCVYTQHELCAVTMYYVCISVPYMRQIRSSKHSPSNALDLGPLHERLVAFINTLIDNPSLVIGSDIWFKTATFDGLPWSHPEAVGAVQASLPELPHLKDLMVALLIGARDTWIRFSSEFAAGGAIDKATPEQRARAWCDKTNDACESEFGIFRQKARKNPNLSLAVHNAQEMYARNNTASFIRTCSPAMRKFFRRIAREQDNSGVNVKTRREMIQVRKEKANLRAEKADKNAQRKKDRLEKQARVVPILTVTEVDNICGVTGQRDANYFKNDLIREQLQWLFEHDVKCIPKTKNQRGSDRPALIELWKKGVREYVDSGKDRSEGVDVGADEGMPNIDEDEPTAISKALGLEGAADEEDSDGYDSEDDFYGSR